MNADDNCAWIDEHSRVHFITTYSTYFAQDLAVTPLDHFEPADTTENRRRIEEGQEDERLHYVLSIKKGSRTPERRLETPRKAQSEVLSAFGYRVDESGVLQGPVG